MYGRFAGNGKAEFSRNSRLNWQTCNFFLLEALAHHPKPVVRTASAKTLTLICETIARTTLLEAFLHDEDRVGGARVGLKIKPAVSNRVYTDKTHLEWVKEFLLDRALTFSSQNESISIVVDCLYSIGSEGGGKQNKK
jgi:hypothetical protein